MKKSFLCLALLLALFSACKKENIPAQGYYVKYKLNGTLVTNTRDNYLWLKPEEATPSRTMFQLVSNTPDFKRTLAITIQKTGSINTGTYESTNNSYFVIPDYFVEQGSSNERDYTTDSVQGMPASIFTVSLTSITDHEIRGTFSCNYLYDRYANENVQITDGEFFVRRIK